MSIKIIVLNPLIKSHIYIK